MMISIHLRVYRGLSVSHTSHSITRNTLLLPNLAKNHQPRHSPWLLPLISLGDVFCPLLSDHLDKNTRKDKKDRKHESKNKEVKRGKNEFSAMKFLILQNNRSKEVRKVFEILEKEQRGKERHLHNIASHGAFLRKKKKKKSERWLDATDVRGRDQWQLNAHRLHALDYVTTRSNGQDCFQSCTGSSTRVNLEISFFLLFKGDFFFLKKIRMIIFEHFFRVKICSLLQKMFFFSKKCWKKN